MTVEVVVYQVVRYVFEDDSVEAAQAKLNSGMWPDDNNMVMQDRVVIHAGDTDEVLFDSDPEQDQIGGLGYEYKEGT